MSSSTKEEAIENILPKEVSNRTESSPLLADRADLRESRVVFDGEHIIVTANQDGVCVTCKDCLASASLKSSLLILVGIATGIFVYPAWITTWKLGLASSTLHRITIEFTKLVFLQSIWVGLFACVYLVISHETDFRVRVSREKGMLSTEKKTGPYGLFAKTQRYPLSEIRHFTQAISNAFGHRSTNEHGMEAFSTHAVEAVSLGPRLVFFRPVLWLGRIPDDEIVVAVSYLNQSLGNSRRVVDTPERPRELLPNSEHFLDQHLVVTQETQLISSPPAHSTLDFYEDFSRDGVRRNCVILRRGQKHCMIAFLVLCWGIEWFSTLLWIAHAGRYRRNEVASPLLIICFSLAWFAVAVVIFLEWSSADLWHFGRWRITSRLSTMVSKRLLLNEEFTCLLSGVECVEIRQQEREGSLLESSLSYDVRLLSVHGQPLLQIERLTEGEALFIAYLLRREYPQLFECTL